MKIFTAIILILNFNISHSQELDIFQNDSIYLKNKISIRTMYSIYEDSVQKELVTCYNKEGKRVKQTWFWNGDSIAHNTETFFYLNNGLLSRIANSIIDGDTETTTLWYNKNLLEYQVTVNENSDTTNFRTFSEKNTTIQRWYSDGKACRFDTTIFEKENVKKEYKGIDNGLSWDYKFHNSFDVNGNLIKVESNNSLKKYFFDSRNLLIKKQEIYFMGDKQTIETTYNFIYE